MKELTYEEAFAFVKAHPYGTAETTPSGLDVSMIRADLKLTPAERLREVMQVSNFFIRHARKLHPPEG